MLPASCRNATVASLAQTVGVSSSKAVSVCFLAPVTKSAAWLVGFLNPGSLAKLLHPGRKVRRHCGQPVVLLLAPSDFRKCLPKPKVSGFVENAE